MFPEQALETALAAFWEHQVRVMVELEKMAPTDSPIDASMHLDSQIAVEVLCELEPIMGVPLKDDAIRKGGYMSYGQFKSYTLGRMRSIWIKRAAKGPSRG